MEEFELPIKYGPKRIILFAKELSFGMIKISNFIQPLCKKSL